MNLRRRDDLPWFPLFASRILSDRRFKTMSDMETSLYFRILLECWHNGSVPIDPVQLALVLGRPLESVQAGLTETVLSFFEVSNGAITSPELEAYYQKQTNRRAKLSENGKKGQIAKKANAKANASTDAEANAKANVSTGVEARLNSIKLNSIKSNSVSKEDSEDPSLDPWVRKYDDEEKRRSTYGTTTV